MPRPFAHSLCQGSHSSFPSISTGFFTSRRILIDEPPTVCQWKFTHCVEEVTDQIAPPKSVPVIKAPHNQVSPYERGARSHPSVLRLSPLADENSSTVHLTPSFPTRPGSSTLIDSHSERSLTAENHRRPQTGKEFTVKKKPESRAGSWIGRFRLWNRSSLARSRWGQGGRGNDHPAEKVLGGALAIGTSREGIRQFVATTLQSPYTSFSLGEAEDVATIAKPLITPSELRIAATRDP